MLTVTKTFLTSAIVLTPLAWGQGRNAELYAQVFGNQPGLRVVDEGFNSRVVRGQPFSAVEERKFLQVLRDGTRIETNQTNRIFRDGEGRTRVVAMDGIVTIGDAVKNFKVVLDPVKKTARRSGGAFFFLAFDSPAPAQSTTGMTSETTDIMGPQLVNGVMATGTRTTVTIGKGQIGNDRDIKTVTERWVSKDLNLLIKSVYSDPRFGDTNYQLTQIVAKEPDAALFQIPADYTVVEESPLNPGRNAGAVKARSLLQEKSVTLPFKFQPPQPAPKALEK
jgi:hypothetical protein